MAKKSFKAPNTIVLMFIIMISVAGLTWIIPAGEYDRTMQDGREVVVPSGYNEVEGEPATIFDLFLVPFKGFTESDAVAIIVFILFVAGSFSIIEETGTLRQIIQRAARFFNRNEKVRPMFIPFFMLLFSIMGSTFGMSEETIVFIPLFVGLSLALGYDAIVGISIPFIGAGLGFAGAVYNPFTVGIAQGLAEIPIFSGAGFRFVLWLTITSVGILLISLYGKKIYKNPELSSTFKTDKKRREEFHFNLDEQSPLTGAQWAILMMFLGGMALLIIGVKLWGWYIMELATLFLVMGIAAALISRMDGDTAVDAFIKGMNNVMGVAIVVALSKGLLILMADAKIIDSVLHSLSSVIGDLAPVVSANLMLGVQTLINFFIPSGSGQAALTIPIMAPLGDIIGLSRQTIVLIYQLGDGITNLIIPTSGVTLGVLGMAKVEWVQWAKWLLPKILVLYGVAMVFISAAIVIGY
jgi:uncharacterized ion transporter superfamily protein YfcC